LFINFADHIDGDTPQNNQITNNIFAFTKKRVLQRGGENRMTFSFTRNIVYWNQGTIQANPGKWNCMGDCPSRFLLDYNLYWNPSGQKPEFFTGEGGAGGGGGGAGPRASLASVDMKGWQQMGEDNHSIFEDPMFVNPNYPADDFSLKPGSPASKIGFVPFDPRQAGRSNPVIKVPPVPPAFPLQLMDPKDF
jgi:hypothetical protein